MVTSISHPTQKNYLENTTCSQLLIKTQEFFASGFSLLAFSIERYLYSYHMYILQITAGQCQGIYSTF